MHHTCLHRPGYFQTSPKPPKTYNSWLLVFHLENSTLVRCIKLALQISCQNSLCPPLVVCPLFYMESKSHLCETSHIFGSLCPFANPHSTECHTLFWTLCVHLSLPAHQSLVSWIDALHPWSCATCLVRSSCVYHCDSSWMCQ
jgi:hypothetical protein